MYLPRAPPPQHAILAQCFEHGHWRSGLSGTRQERARGRKGEKDREEEERRRREDEKDNISMCVLKNENGTVCKMFNAGGSGRGGVQSAFPLRVTSHTFSELSVANKSPPHSEEFSCL